MTTDQLRQLLAEATELPWHFDLDRQPPHNIAALVTAEDARLAEATVNLAPLLLDVVEAARATQDCGGIETFTDDADRAWITLRNALAALDEVTP